MKTNAKHWASITAGILSLAGYAPGASLGREKYTYDASGNIIEKLIDGKVTKMSYDKSNRLLNKQAQGQNPEAISYDAAGRPVVEQDAMGQTRGMKYGYGDKVLEVNCRNSRTEFFHNATGQLVAKSVNGMVTPYAWDDNVLASEADKNFSNEAHICGGVPVLNSSGAAIVSDFIGNTLREGEKEFNATAFGIGLEDARYTGKTFVKELKSFVFLHRQYSSESGRWQNDDPLGYPDGRNNKAYSGNDPINNVDPIGCNFLYFDNETIYEYDGDGYLHPPDGEEGAIDWGDVVQSWSAISNGDDQNNEDGGTPDGWYNVGNQKPNSEVLQDVVGSPDTLQEGMSLWSRYGSDYGTDIGSGTGRTGRKCTTTIYTGGTLSKATWAFNMGNNFIPMRLKNVGHSEYWEFPSSERRASSIQMHPEGKGYGTLGCIGLVGFNNAESFRSFANSDGSFMEIFVEF